MDSPPVTLQRTHAQRLRQVYRSPGWPYQDGVEIDLLAAGLLERVTTNSGHVLVKLTDAGIAHLAGATQEIRCLNALLLITGFVRQHACFALGLAHPFGCLLEFIRAADSRSHLLLCRQTGHRSCNVKRDCTGSQRGHNFMSRLFPDFFTASQKPFVADFKVPKAEIHMTQLATTKPSFKTQG